uniref:NADH-ubiquinone oxidoreductase chain 4 n=1 Tax=Populus alba TaxID=43335 RepID=A0A4U5PYN3_POPAL|nr:NADH-ubiquinone oxidoreductase chain 4 (mitochondrion) [Populus alba]
MLLAILLILLQTGTTDLQISLTTEFSERRQIFLWIASFASFAVKVPMVPVHIWLPEAHVEAPTAGSVILAGIPLKLGTYGFLRFSIPMFPEATLFSTPFIYTPSAIAIIYTSLTTSRQIDLKKIIAYSSVAHMNLVTIGMFSRAAAVRAPKRFLGQLSSLIHRSNALGSSHGAKIGCCSPLRRIPFSPRHRPTQKERAQSPGPTCRSANVKRGVEPELANRRCTNDNSKRHTSAAYLPFRWHQRDPAKGAPPARLPIKEAESKRKLTRKPWGTTARSGEGKGVGPTYPDPIGPHKGSHERFHRAEGLLGGESLALSNIQGIGGSILPMLSHGLVPSALFLCVGVLYDRHKTRLVRYYGGLVSTMPNLSTIFFSSTLANMSSPGTSSFIGEFLISVGAFQRNSLVATLAALGMILGAAYSLWLYNRVVSGNLKPDFLHKFSDSNGREVSIFIPFLVGGATVR